MKFILQVNRDKKWQPSKRVKDNFLSLCHSGEKSTKRDMIGRRILLYPGKQYLVSFTYNDHKEYREVFSELGKTLYRRCVIKEAERKRAKLRSSREAEQYEDDRPVERSKDEEYYANEEIQADMSDEEIKADMMDEEIRADMRGEEITVDFNHPDYTGKAE